MVIYPFSMNYIATKAIAQLINLKRFNRERKIVYGYLTPGIFTNNKQNRKKSQLGTVVAIKKHWIKKIMESSRIKTNTWKIV